MHDAETFLHSSVLQTVCLGVWRNRIEFLIEFLKISIFKLENPNLIVYFNKSKSTVPTYLNKKKKGERILKIHRNSVFIYYYVTSGQEKKK